MSTLHLPWLELSILIPLVGALAVGRALDRHHAQKWSIAIASLALLCAAGAWQDFNSLRTFEAHDRWDAVTGLFGYDMLVIDELSAPLLPLAALLYLATIIATPRTKSQRFSFAGSLASLAILLATLSCKTPWILIGLLAAGTVQPYLELRARRKPARVYVLHMTLFVGLLIAGQWLATGARSGSTRDLLGVSLLTAAVVVRSGIFPLHVWMTNLFEHASFGTALLFVTPMAGAYAAVRLVLPLAPDATLRVVALLSLFTAVYGAGMALVQSEPRRFFCYLFISHSSLVLVGVELATPIGLTGALSLWLSVGLALSGFGLTLRSVEARTGRLSLAAYHGLYEHMPTLAAVFLLTGLASVGFPGTFGFIGTELLVEGAVASYPLVGMAVVLASALNGVAVLQTYFRLFAGTRHATSISLRIRPLEKIAVVTMAALILGGGLFPQPGVSSRNHAAMELIKLRRMKPAGGGSLTAAPDAAIAPLPSSDTNGRQPMKE